MSLRTIDQANLKNKKVLVRVDLNVPLSNGKVTDLTRINSIGPTVNYLLEQNSKIILCAHLGRPEGKPNPEFSLKQILPDLSSALNQQIEFVSEVNLQSVEAALKNSNIVLLENTRFFPEEESNDPIFAEKLASLADVYINDAFGTCHRAHASTEGVAHFLPSYAGKLLESEIKALTPVRDGELSAPFTLIIGGAKIDTKIGILKNFITKADSILVGGALANTFLLAMGENIGDSKVETDKVEVAQEIMLLAEKHKTQLLLPTDAIIADEVNASAQTLNLPVQDIEGQMKILDIGQETIQTYKSIIERSASIVWNGPMGLYELAPFAKGTEAIGQAVASSHSASFIGGGDTIDAINNLNIDASSFTHISTGGGAMVEFIEGQDFPAIKVLMS